MYDNFKNFRDREVLLYVDYRKTWIYKDYVLSQMVESISNFKYSILNNSIRECGKSIKYRLTGDTVILGP